MTYEEWHNSEDGPLSSFVTDDDLKRAFYAGAKSARSALTKGEWEIIASLVGTGVNECPWGWESDWPEGIDGGDTNRIVTKFRQFLKEAGNAS